MVFAQVQFFDPCHDLSSCLTHCSTAGAIAAFAILRLQDDVDLIVYVLCGCEANGVQPCAAAIA